MFNTKSNNELLKEYDSIVVGHDTAKKALITLVNRSRIRHYQKWGLLTPNRDLLSTSKILLIGASGTGKTYLLDTLKTLVDFPLLKVDATKLTLTSADGGIKNSDLEKLIESTATAWSEERTKQGYTNSVDGAIDKTVVFIDEIDKMGWGKGSSDSWNKRTQANFLSVFEDSDKFAGVSFVFAGAFTGMRDKEINSKPIGFYNDNSIDVIKNSIEENIIDYGLITELVGRLTNIIELDELTPEHYNKIMDDLLVPKMRLDLKQFGVEDLHIDKDNLINEAIKSKQGVRYLKRELNKISLDLEFNYEDVDTNCCNTVQVML